MKSNTYYMGLEGKRNKFDLQGSNINGMVIYNDTPAHIFIGNSQVSAQNYYAVVPPFHYASLPLQVGDKCWFFDGAYCDTRDEKPYTVIINLLESLAPYNMQSLGKRVELEIFNGPENGDPYELPILAYNYTSPADFDNSRIYIPSIAKRKTLYLQSLKELTRAEIWSGVTLIDMLGGQGGFGGQQTGVHFVAFDLSSVALPSTGFSLLFNTLATPVDLGDMTAKLVMEL